LREKGSAVVLRFCDRAGIDVAGFDLMFPDDGELVFVEINYHFGRKGLGGTNGHKSHLLRAIQAWRWKCLETEGINPGRHILGFQTKVSPDIIV